MSLLWNELNPKQREATFHTKGPLLILAGAGSGKTKTMTYRIVYLLTEKKIPPSAILGLSFTNKAAKELRDRVQTLSERKLGKGATQGLIVSTFHSLCVRILRAHAEKIGFTSQFSILDQNDQEELVRLILKKIKIDDRKFDPRSVLFQIGQAKNRFLNPDQAQEFFLNGGTQKLPSDYQIATVSTYEHYQSHLKLRNAMDFDDLLYWTVMLLEKNPEVRAFYQKRFQQILVDEYQDTNPAQFRLLKLLLGSHQNLCVVGDDDQSIYSWRGADPAHILEFHHEFPTAKQITLSQNYRSTSTILEAANEVIQNNPKRHSKELWSDLGTGEPLTELISEADREEAENVAEEILKLAQERKDGNVRTLRLWKDFAILYRSNPQSRLFEEALRMRQIPYQLVGTLSFLERKEIRDVLSYWKLILNSKDDASARRIVNWPARGIGKSSLEKMNQRALEQGLSFFESLKTTEGLPLKAQEGIQRFTQLIHALQADLSQTPAEPEAIAQWALRSFDRIGVKKALLEDYEDAIVAGKKWENVEELGHAMGQFRPDPTEGSEISSHTFLRDYLTRLTLEAQEEEDEEKEDVQKNQVTLMTLHGAKGLEFPIVFLVGMEEGFLPHRKTLEEAKDLSEERRLCYVGITRAKEKLYLSRARNRIRWGKTIPRTPSRFLEEIPKSVVLTDDQSHTPDLSQPDQQKQHEERVTNFLSKIRAQISEKPL